MVRYGNWAMDTGRNRLGQVVRRKWGEVILCSTDGVEWRCPEDEHRIATKPELRAAGLLPEGS